MLEKFRLAKQREINHLRKAAESGDLPMATAAPNRGFAAALLAVPASSPLAVIAEYKRASPSRGLICDSLPVENVAMQYAEAGAAAMSILTEEDWFKGELAFVDRAFAALDKGRPMPLLRKDFIYDSLQIRATAATNAAAVLLITRCVPDSRLLRALREEAELSGLDCVVEIFNMEDLELARESGARIIQVNARDLDTFAVSRQACLDLIAAARPQKDEIWIAASGMEKAAHLQQAADAGFQAALVGTALMSGGKPGEKLGEMLSGAQCNAG